MARRWPKSGSSASWARVLSGLMMVAAACNTSPPDVGQQIEAAPPSPREDSRTSSAEPEPSEPEPAPPLPSVEHTIEEGETLWDIARAYHVSVDDILRANGMRARDTRRLRVGGSLTIPGAEAPAEVETAADRASVWDSLPELENAAWHRLAEGETLWDVAHLYDVSLSDIVEKNELDDDAVRLLRPGQPIAVPGVSERDVARAAARRVERPAQARRSFLRHEVARGETIWSLAGSFGVAVAEIMAANRMSPDDATGLREGATLIIPGVDRDARGRIQRRLTRRQRAAMARAAAIGLGNRRAGQALLHGRMEPAWLRMANRGTNQRLPGSLRWPVSNGWFVRGYGSGEGGYHLATDIMGEIGWNVRAAAAGVVGYSGDEIPGYGNVVLIIHPGGWITMYAHNSVNFAVPGERVPAGGIIAEVGSTGISRGPHVHFEFIFEGKNCDPAQLWRPGIRHRDGHLSPISRVSWNDPERKPRSIACHPRRRHPRSRWVIHEELGN